MSDIGKIIRVNALPSPDKRENNVIYQVAAPGAATYKDYAIDSSGDLKTPSYIPLTGTEEGKPLTKNIEVDPSEEGSVGLISNTPDVSEAVLVIQENDSILAESSNSSENNSSSIHIHYDDGIEISATTSDEQFSAIIDTSGLKGDHYIPPTSDEHYVQKKFVADNFTSQTALNNTLADYYTSAQTDNLFYDKSEVDAKLSAVYRPKGSVANFASLPSSGNTEGDVWNVLDTGSNYVWVINLNNTGVAGWDKLSETVDLTNYITLNTEQTITGRKMFSGSIGNTFDTLGLEVRGNGSTDTIYPGISFHQPGLYAASMYYNSAGFHFRNINNTGYDNIYANSFHKSGSDDSYVLTGGGGHKSISDFITETSWNNITGKKWFKTDGGNTWDNNTARIQGINGYDAGLTFYRDGIGIGQIIFNGYYFNLKNDTDSFVQIKTAGFLKDGSDANHVLLGNGDHKLLSDFATTTQLGNYHNIDSAGLINNGSDTRSNKSWFDYNWAGLANTAGSVINFSGLNGNYSVELFGEYYSDRFGIRSHNGDTNGWNPVRWLWHSGNFDPANYYKTTGLGIANNQSELLPNGSQWISTGNSGTGFDGELSNQLIEGTFTNFNGNTNGAKSLGFTLFARTSTDQGIYYKTWYGSGQTTWKRLIDSGDIQNYVTLNTPQVIIADKSFSQTAKLTLYGTEFNQNNTQSYNTTNGMDNVSAGWVHTFYGSRWKYGIVRGGDSSADGVKFGFDFSSDGGATYDRKLSIDANSGALELKSGGNIDARGNLTLRQEFVGGSATGIWWWNTAYSERISGIGALTTDGILDYNYIGWGVSPWATTQCLAVGENTFTYKGNQVWHSGNLEDYHQYGLGTVVEVGATDMDTISQTSVLGINDGTANRPAGVGYGSVWTHRKSSTEFTQLATEIFSGQLFTRAKSDAGGFTPWRKQWDSVNLPNPVNQSDLGNYLTYTGATQNVNLNTKRLLNVGNPLDYYIESIQAGGKIASYGNENNSVKTFVSSVALDSIVAGHTFDFYNTSWKAGNKRGGSANSLGFSFEFSNDGGATYTEKARIDESGFFTGNAFASPILTGAQVFNANNTNQLFFGNTVIPDVFYQTLNNHLFQVNNSTIATINATGLSVNGNIATTGSIYAGGFNSNVFVSPVLAGGSYVINTNASELYFGNNLINTVVNQTGSYHTWNVGGNQVALMNAGGLAVTGALSLNGSDVVTGAQKGAANGVAPLGADTKIPSVYLPSYVDDVLEFVNLVSFPTTGEAGKIYVALDTNLTYRWGGSSYTQIASGAVQSINGQTGIVNLSKSDIGLSNIDNTTDATKNVLSATKWTTPRTLSYTGDVTGSASVDGSGNVNFAMTLANSGVSAGTYNSVNVDAKGRVLSGNHINYATESYVADLLQQNYFDQTVADERFVNTEGDETINGNKTFSSSPSIPAATNGEHAVNLEQLTASLSNVVYDNDDFEILEVYRLIDSNHFDLDDTRIKKYNIVFDGASNGSVNITHLRDNQYYQFSNVSGSGADLRVGVEGYGMVDVVSSGKTAVYMSWGDGKLLKISENTNVSII